MQIQLDNLAAQLEILANGADLGAQKHAQQIRDELKEVKQVKSTKQKPAIQPQLPLSEKELKKQIGKALQQPPPRRLILPMESGALSVSPGVTKTSAAEMFELSERRFQEGY